jgi:hypothetical protein
VPDLTMRKHLDQSRQRHQCAAGLKIKSLPNDRSDGGLFACVRWRFSRGNVGVALNIDMLLVEGDGISDSRNGRGRQ